MSAENDMRRELAKAEQRVRDIHTTTAILAQQSIKFGSELTGAPGQPVDSGALRDSYVIEKTGADTSTVTSLLPYARAIEEGVGPHGPLTLRSPVGGFHSIAQTIANMDKVVDAAVKAVYANAP